MTALAVPRPLPLGVGFGGDGWATPVVAEAHRAHQCASYLRCLARAWTDRWQGWSCRACRSCTVDLEEHQSSMRLEDIWVPEREAEEPAEWADVVRGTVASILAREPWELVVTAEEDEPRLLAGWAWYEAARIIGVEWAPVVQVGLAACPICAAGMLIPDAAPLVLRDGWCVECGGVVVADGLGFRVVRDADARSREAQRLHRIRAHQGDLDEDQDGHDLEAEVERAAEQIAWEWFDRSEFKKRRAA